MNCLHWDNLHELSGPVSVKGLKGCSKRCLLKVLARIANEMNTQYQLKVSVFGHSFVRRLSEYMALDSSRGNLRLDTNVLC